MKYGLVYFDKTDNIGDDIQSYAVMHFLPQIDYLIDRERMNEFMGDIKEPVAVVLSGWFLHKKFNWPPSKDIYPFCTSLHFSVNDYMGIGYSFLDGLGGEYLKNYGPIGCRDTSTLEALQKRGIPSYLSGCATLTLSPREKKKNDNYICLVDVSDNVYLKAAAEIQGTGIEIKRMTHAIDYAKNPIEWQARISKVEEFLDIYQNAKCVVTKRLHCALPCLAFKTPVLLLLDTDKDDVSRYSHFVELLNVASTEEYLSGMVDYDLSMPPKNKENYISESKELAEAIREFISQTQNNQLKNSFQIWNETDDTCIIQWQKDLSTRAALYASSQIDVLLRQKNQLEADTFKKITEMSEQYEQDTTVLKQYLSKQEAENKRLNNVIIEKTTDVQRLDDVVLKKEQEILRINHKIQEYEQNIKEYEYELLTVNQILHKKEQDIEELNNQITAHKEEIDYWKNILRQVDTFIKYKEENSVSWALFHSKKFKGLKVREKITFIKKIHKKHAKENRYYLEDISAEINNIPNPNSSVYTD